MCLLDKDKIEPIHHFGLNGFWSINLHIPVQVGQTQHWRSWRKREKWEIKRRCSEFLFFFTIIIFEKEIKTQVDASIASHCCRCGEIQFRMRKEEEKKFTATTLPSYLTLAGEHPLTILPLTLYFSASFHQLREVVPRSNLKSLSGHPSLTLLYTNRFLVTFYSKLRGGWWIIFVAEDLILGEKLDSFRFSCQISKWNRHS